MPRRIPDRRFRRDSDRKERHFGGYYSRGPRYDAGPQREAPVKEGEEYDVSIEAVGQRGDGLAKIQGFAVFVPGTKVGDKPKVRIESIRGNFAVASVVEGEVRGESEMAGEGEALESEGEPSKGEALESEVGEEEEPSNGD